MPQMARTPKDLMTDNAVATELRNRRLNDLAVYDIRAWIAKQNKAVQRRNAEIRLMSALFFLAILSLCAAWWLEIAAEWHVEARAISSVPFAICILVALLSSVALIVLGRRNIR